MSVESSRPRFEEEWSVGVERGGFYTAGIAFWHR